MELLPAGKLAESFRIAHAIAEIDERAAVTRQPYVGVSAFAHKAGLHASAIKVDPGPLPAHGSGAGGQRHADACLRDGRPGSVELKGSELGFDLCSDRDWSAG